MTHSGCRCQRCLSSESAVALFRSSSPFRSSAACNVDGSASFAAGRSKSGYRCARIVAADGDGRDLRSDYRRGELNREIDMSIWADRHRCRWIRCDSEIGRTRRRRTLLMMRLVVPTLKTSRFNDTVLPAQVGPNSRLFCGLTAITGPVAAANSKTPRPKVDARSTPAIGLICSRRRPHWGNARRRASSTSRRHPPIEVRRGRCRRKWWSGVVPPSSASPSNGTSRGGETSVTVPGTAGRRNRELDFEHVAARESRKIPTSRNTGPSGRSDRTPSGLSPKRACRELE